MVRMPPSVAIVLTLSALVMVAGCGSDSRPVNAPPPREITPPPAQASSPPTRASVTTPSPTAASLSGFRADLVESQRQVDVTLNSLKELTDPATADLRGAYNHYCDNLARMNHHAAELRREVDAMRTSRDQYFGKWEQRVTEIDNPTIRNSAEARRKRLRDAHERIITVSGEARDAYGPFMQDLQDVRKFLSTDLSRGAIADLGDASRKLQSEGAVVKQRIGAVVESLDGVEGHSS